VTQGDDLGKCPACDTPLICNSREAREDYHVALPGAAVPPKAYYPNFYHDIEAVWCPNCGLAKSVAFPDLRVSSLTPEFRDWLTKRGSIPLQED